PSQVAADKAQGKQATAFAQPAADTDATTELAKVAAPTAAASSRPDGAQTAAIPEVQPSVANRSSADHWPRARVCWL
ncbi:MAG: SH3 domain-containing protein, partial [Mesorhizobium sp.]